MMRLAYGRFAQETHVLSTVPTTIDDFRATHFYAGEELAARCQKGAREVEGFMKDAELSGFVQRLARADAELVPLLSAWAVPSGKLSRACFEEILGGLLERLKDAGAVDGVYLSLHGAMRVEGLDEAEGEIVRRVRAQLGEAVPLVVSLDLHANLTAQLVDNVDHVVVYRTNPHRDHKKTGARAAALLRQCVRARQTGAPKVTRTWRSLPMLLGGGSTVDFFPTMRPIFRRLKALDKDPRVVTVSVCLAHPWNDHPHLGWSVYVATHDDMALAERLADELADLLWSVKDVMPPTFSTAERAIAKAKRAWLRRKLGVVNIADYSDVVSAGAPGENTALIQALLEHGEGLLSYVPLRDPVVVDALWTEAVGSAHQVTLGGKLDPARGRPLSVRAQIVNKVENHGVGRTVVLAVEHVRVVVVEGPALAMAPSFFEQAGLSVRKADVVVVKNFFPFLIYFLPYARMTQFVKTEGITDLDSIFSQSFDGPMHPRDVVDDWRPADARRRQAPAVSTTARAA